MQPKAPYSEPYSTSIRKGSLEDKVEIVNTMRWVARVNLILFSVLIPSYYFTGLQKNMVIMLIGSIPIGLALVLFKRNAVSLPSILLAVSDLLTITALATVGQGLYDIALLGMPVILIVAASIMRGHIIFYLTTLSVVCVSWLGLGDYFGWYQPAPINFFNLHDLPVAIIILLVAGNAAHRLSKNIQHNLALARRELGTRLLAEKEREALIGQLKAKNQELDRFAVRVSHDLKSPLITIAGFLGFIERDIKEGNFERVERNFTQVNDAAKSMGTFIDELLDLSRVGRIINPPKDVDFSEIVQDAIKGLEGVLRAKQVQLEIDPNFPIVHVDRIRLVQAIQNLVSNAVKFMGKQEHPRIQIRCNLVNGEAVFSITDNGIGIDQAHHENIFELFSKIDNNSDGIGIGLGLVKKIIEVHQGRIWVESKLGEGSAFKFTLKNSSEIKG